ncbi:MULTISPECIES: metal ABC transporter solute-binding protein, Zn/Mn family [unclassified Gemella]|uniref:metal ABC transporter solute-binding protein, Zn/Mn family n=1 Tax=unclassified Gemella TaxID=2624949 RepID=UPI001C03C2AE|nr:MULTISPECIES: zinc ABC transporter substrate-binding protein [unclassified Gemella]MBU0278749.1 zinc ABC transporter substrate-binding protein [Gemella sp. zg-1178]QWQ38689.1 zinc ABC transporter substrate-binding protein [Gemella sp. zg-570]
MKKLQKIIAICLVLVFTLTACSSKSTNNTQTDKKTVTVTTSFLADMTKELVGDKVNIETIIPAGEDPHLYVAKASDLKKIKDADLVLYHGLHFEGKMVEALESRGQAVSKDFPKDKINTMEEDGVKLLDPHFWFDIDLYKMAVEAASKELSTLLPDQADLVKTNTTNYLAKLDELDKWIKTELDKIPAESRYLITPHDAFTYFGKKYNVKVEAPQGITTESEVDNKAMIETVNLIIEKKIKAIFSESTTNPERMEKLKEAVAARGHNVKVVTGEGQELFSDSLAPQGQAGDTYIEMYKHNINLIVENLK